MLSIVAKLSARYFQVPNVAKVTSTNSFIQVKQYSRLNSRRPVAIVNEDELYDFEEADHPEKKQHYSERRDQKSHKNEQTSKNSEGKMKTASKFFRNKTKKQPKQNRPLSQFDSPTKTMFTKLYENEEYLAPLMMSIKSRKKRQVEDKILLEGTRLITDAIQAGSIPDKIIFTQTAELQKLPLPESGTKIFKVPYRTIQLWSSLTAPSGIMGIFNIPDVEAFVAPNSLPITIICDNIRDPGNMGSILRAAAGVGCESVILSKGCVDIWEPKVLRSAAGAHFRLTIHSHKEWDEIRQVISPQSQVIVADNNNDSNYSLKKEFSSDEAELPNDEEEDIEEENDEENDKEKSNLKTKKNKYEKIDFSSKIPVIPYFSKDFTQGETVIIVGGETEGLSEDSFKLVTDTRGVRVNIPLNNGVESLNSGMAVGIIAFEIKRQFLLAAEKTE